MKTITTFIFVKNLNTEKTILESVKNFKGLELLECVSDRYTLIERKIKFRNVKNNLFYNLILLIFRLILEYFG